MICREILSFILGCIASFAASIIFSYFQYLKSIAYNRQKLVERATHEMVNNLKGNHGKQNHLKNFHRYSLGVPIYRLIMFLPEIGKFENEDVLIPSTLLPDSTKVDWTRNDGWALYNSYIRPVINDISTFFFITSFSTIFRKTKKLKILIELCLAIENYVAVIDKHKLNQRQKSFDLIHNNDFDSLKLIRPSNIQDEAIAISYDEIITSIGELSKCWDKWLKSLKINLS